MPRPRYADAVAGWSFRKGAAVELLSRFVVTESLDGHRVQGRLSVRFQRAVSQELAEQITTGIENEVIAVVNEALCQDGLPFTGEELVAKVKVRSLSASGKGVELRVEALEVAGARGARASSRAAPPSTPGAHLTGTSGVMPAMGARTSRVPPSAADSTGSAARTLWPRVAIASAAGHDPGRFGRLFAPCLRDSTASLVLAALGAVDPACVDRLGLLEARPAPLAMAQLKREAMVSLTAVFLRALVGASVERQAADLLATALLEEALAPEPAPVAELRRYVESPAPLRDLATRAAALLGSPADAFRILSAMAEYGTVLRADLLSTALDVQRQYGAA
jgi:hypothetical protein